ncbi:hypothetical protein DL764_005182 [Monosporascus ibericus]|uniref:Rhamnogalacturonase A/B/Epimerase-like pectate lyase domain-containing protein n=1 Tax=Monosporascus ibericus TaxID=155417 RepID=A0A4Q4TDE0_9PEZI|nr:hypothetical protein DL764_005182 [Monosporascus ibericus]
MAKFADAITGLLAARALASPVPQGDGAAQNAPRQATSYWYANMDHTGPYRGYAPGLDNSDSYTVFVSVSPGDGGAGIQRAINDASNGATRHGQWLASEPRVVYIPPGTYEVSETIYMNTATILVGDATDNGRSSMASKNPQGRPMTGDVNDVQQAKTRPRVRNTTHTVNPAGFNGFALTREGTEFTALYWGVAQVAQLSNVKIRMAYSVNGRGHSGIRLGRGSTLGLADVRVERGQNGIWHDGHQQALYKSIYFYQNTVGMLISGANTITIHASTFDTVGTAVLNTGGSPYIGLIDAKSVNSGITLRTTVYPSILIDNLTKDTDSAVVVVPERTVLGARSHVDTFTYGNTVGRDPVYGETASSVPRPASLAPGGDFLAIPAPSYAGNTVDDFINVKDPAQNGGHEVLGDNTRDESAVLNQILRYAAESGKIAYFPFGLYRVDDTLFVPAGSRIVGEAWAAITGNGEGFKDSSSPKPVVQIGNPGDVGVAQISDMRFTVSDVLPGAIIVQYHMAGNSPGDVALWNSMIETANSFTTVGGTRGAEALTNACRDAANECRGASIGLHLAKTSSAYIENVWNWVADHITEDFDGGSRIAAKGGTLVEAAAGGTWLHALGSEHYWLYQLNLRGARGVFVSLLQSETNYDQGDNVEQTPPAPWVPDVASWGDPDFSWCSAADTRCRMGFSNYIQGGSDIYHYGSASWAFFSGPGYQSCAGTYACQNHMHWITETPDNLQVFGLCSKDSWAALRLADGTNIVTSPNFTGSWPGGGALIGRYTP